jgi:Rad3-related DNA helicase
LHTDNPAGRLLHILQDGKNKPPRAICKDVWFQLLEVEGKNFALLMPRLGKVMELPEQIVSQIQYHYPNQSNTCKHWSGRVNTAFSMQNLNGTWQEFNKYIDENTINYLSIFADLLDTKENIQILKEDKLSEIREKINDLLTDILDENIDIDENFKNYIVNYLRKITIAIEEYKISGATPIVESIEKILGHSFIDEEYRENLFKTKTGNKIITTLEVVASVVTIAVGLPELSEPLHFLLSNVSK